MYSLGVLPKTVSVSVRVCECAQVQECAYVYVRVKCVCDSECVPVWGKCPFTTCPGGRGRAGLNHSRGQAWVLQCQGVLCAVKSLKQDLMGEQKPSCQLVF